MLLVWLPVNTVPNDRRKVILLKYDYYSCKLIGAAINATCNMYTMASAITVIRGWQKTNFGQYRNGPLDPSEERCSLNHKKMAYSKMEAVERSHVLLFRIEERLEKTWGRAAEQRFCKLLEQIWPHQNIFDMFLYRWFCNSGLTCDGLLVCPEKSWSHWIWHSQMHLVSGSLPQSWSRYCFKGSSMSFKPAYKRPMMCSKVPKLFFFGNLFSIQW